jgi:hypothetical protein
MPRRRSKRVSQQQPFITNIDNSSNATNRIEPTTPSLLKIEATMMMKEQPAER